MNCPICSTGLTPSAHEFVTVSACPDGHGTWLDHEHLRAIVASRVEDRPEAEEDAAIEQQGAVPIESVSGDQTSCPACGELMQKMNYAYESGVIMDTCREHGIWLDQGELERIEAWVEGNERVAVSERGEWIPKLNEMAADSKRAAADDRRKVHSDPVNWIADRVAPWFDKL